MAAGGISKELEAFIQSIKEEWKGAFHKSPDLTILVLKDERIVAAIEKRFLEHAAVTKVRQLDYDFYTGLFNLVFEFSRGTGNLGRPGLDAFLAIVDSNGKVIGVVDPFDPEQPNIFVPPLPSASEQPFVLDRPSQNVTFSDGEMYPAQVRSREFMQRLQIGGGGVMWPGDPEAYTKCAYTTRTPNDYWTDYQNDDCGLPTTILA